MQCLLISKAMMVRIDRFLRIGSDEIDQACWVSNHDFRTEIIKKLTGVVRQVVKACRNLSDDALLAKLRSCFSDVHPP